jgi:hypothetical protein
MLEAGTRWSAMAGLGIGSGGRGASSEERGMAWQWRGIRGGRDGMGSVWNE